MLISRGWMTVAVIMAFVIIAAVVALVLYLGRDTPEQRWERDRERERNKWRR